MNRFTKTTAALTAALSALLLLRAAPVTAVDYDGSSSYSEGKYASALDGVQLSGDGAADLVAVALSQVGYHESNSSKDLSGEASGNGNCTEYGRWYGLQDMWCAMFVSWCAERAGIGTDVIPKTSSTVVGLNRFLAAGRAHTRAEAENGAFVPQSGDLVYFRFDRNDAVTNHVGIVTDFDGKTLYTVEGNATGGSATSNGGAVCRNSYRITNTRIVYICRPAYRDTPAAQTPGQTDGVSYPTLARGAYGTRVQALQYLLIDAGAQITADGIFGPATENAVRDYQRENGLSADGKAGRATFGSLCAGTQSMRRYDRAAVRAIQTMLNARQGAGLAVDGIYGPATCAAVTAYQRSRGIAADGIVGPVTWQYLLG